MVSILSTFQICGTGMTARAAGEFPTPTLLVSKTVVPAGRSSSLWMKSSGPSPRASTRSRTSSITSAVNDRRIHHPGVGPVFFK